VEKVSAKLRRIPLWKWGWAAWLLAVFAFILLLLLGNENWFEGDYEAVYWIVAGSIIASLAVQTLRFPFRPWIYSLAREKAEIRIAISILISTGFFAYFLFGLLNSIRRFHEFGNAFETHQASGLIYGQIMLPNGYEFGWQDCAVALSLATVVDLSLFMPNVRNNSRFSPLPLIALLQSILLWTLTLVFTMLIRISLAIYM
jgi:hypothetical protein